MNKYERILEAMEDGSKSDVAIYNRCSRPGTDSPELAFAILHAIELYRRNPQFRQYVWRHIGYENSEDIKKRQDG